MNAKHEAHLLITGQRPDLVELFLELAWFRDVIFLWKMLLQPVNVGPDQKNWQSTDSLLQWSWDAKDNRFLVKGFDMVCAEFHGSMLVSLTQRGGGRLQDIV